MAYDAIIETGSKQYAVAVGDVIHIPRIDGQSGDTITFDRILAARRGGTVEAGRPTLEGVEVAAEILAQDRDDKVVIFRFHRRTTYRRKTGHRQLRTTIRITTINA